MCSSVWEGIREKEGGISEKHYFKNGEEQLLNNNILEFIAAVAGFIAAASETAATCDA